MQTEDETILQNAHLDQTVSTSQLVCFSSFLSEVGQIVSKTVLLSSLSHLGEA